MLDPGSDEYQAARGDRAIRGANAYTPVKSVRVVPSAFMHGSFARGKQRYYEVAGDSTRHLPARRHPVFTARRATVVRQCLPPAA
jgi:hypothetical protein